MAALFKTCRPTCIQKFSIHLVFTFTCVFHGCVLCLLCLITSDSISVVVTYLPSVSLFVLSFSALTLLVGCQEEHPACKN